MLVVAIRTVLIYLFLIIGMRLMGKRQIGELQLSELVTTLLLSEMASLPATDPNIPLAFSILPVSLLLLLEIILPFLAARFPFLKKMIDVVPSILIRKGEIDPGEMSRMRISMDELLSQLRLKGVGDLRDVDYAILEQSGQLSVLLKREKQPLTPEDMSMPGNTAGLAHPVIIMGQVSAFNLSFIGRDRQWLHKRLAEKGCRVSDVLLYTVDDSGEETLLRRSAIRKREQAAVAKAAASADNSGEKSCGGAPKNKKASKVRKKKKKRKTWH